MTTRTFNETDVSPVPTTEFDPSLAIHQLCNKWMIKLWSTGTNEVLGGEIGRTGSITRRRTSIQVWHWAIHGIMAQKVSVDMAGGCENTDFWMRADVVALPPQQAYHSNLCLLGSLSTCYPQALSPSEMSVCSSWPYLLPGSRASFCLTLAYNTVIINLVSICIILTLSFPSLINFNFMCTDLVNKGFCDAFFFFFRSKHGIFVIRLKLLFPPLSSKTSLECKEIWHIGMDGSSHLKFLW